VSGVKLVAVSSISLGSLGNVEPGGEFETDLDDSVRLIGLGVAKEAVEKPKAPEKPKG
jgi:hypothetical protein